MPISTENKRMQQLTGRFADLNTSNMLVGEFAVPNDHNPVVKMDNGKIREIPLLSDMNSYEAKIQEVNETMTELNNEYESTKNQLVAATKANADSAASSASSASTYKDNAKTYMDNANAYAKEAKTAASSITGALKPKGTIKFAELPALSTIAAGDMYNISDEFISTNSFKDGGDITYPAGTNVYKTEDGMWDCLGGQLSDYLMRDDIDTAVEEAMPDYATSAQLTELVAGEKMSTALGKIKTAVKNVISLVKLLGTTDISSVGNGTVTGAISALNSNISKEIINKSLGMGAFNVSIDLSQYKTFPANICIASCTDDVGIAVLQGGCIFTVGMGGVCIIASSSTHLTFSAKGNNLVITSKAGYAYGVRLKIVKI